MQAADIPQELKDILDRRAGKIHSAEGRVMQTLAEILTLFEEMIRSGTKAS
jgi:hypothetical protein